MTLTLGGEMLCASFDWINKLSEATHAIVVYIILSCIFVVFVMVVYIILSCIFVILVVSQCLLLCHQYYEATAWFDCPAQSEVKP